MHFYKICFLLCSFFILFFKKTRPENEINTFIVVKVFISLSQNLYCLLPTYFILSNHCQQGNNAVRRQRVTGSESESQNWEDCGKDKKVQVFKKTDGNQCCN